MCTVAHGLWGAAVVLLEVGGDMFGKSHSFVPPSPDHCQVESTTQNFKPVPLLGGCRVSLVQSWGSLLLPSN